MVSALGPPLRGQGQGWVEHRALCSRARDTGPALGRGQGQGPGQASASNRATCLRMWMLSLETKISSLA